jgi:hypothetical protein
MGMGRSAIKVLLQESQCRRLAGRLLTLGVQDVFVSMDELKSVMAEFGIACDLEGEISKKPDLAKGSYITDRCLFGALGFSEVKSLDASDYEGADFAWNLNLPARSDLWTRIVGCKQPHLRSLVGQWDVVLNGGTLEHVFHVPNALENMSRFVKVGGRVIHLIGPSSNHIDHGFYMFSPTLFFDYYSANNFEINACQIVRYENRPDTLWEISDYVPGCLDRVSLGGLDDAAYGVICVATKTRRSTYRNIPEQGLYIQTLWRNLSPAEREKRAAEVWDPNFSGKGLGLRIKYRF